MAAAVVLSIKGCGDLKNSFDIRKEKANDASISRQIEAAKAESAKETAKIKAMVEQQKSDIQK